MSQSYDAAEVKKHTTGEWRERDQGRTDSSVKEHSNRKTWRGRWHWKQSNSLIGRSSTCSKGRWGGRRRIESGVSHRYLWDSITRMHVTLSSSSFHTWNRIVIIRCGSKSKPKTREVLIEIPFSLSLYPICTLLILSLSFSHSRIRLGCGRWSSFWRYRFPRRRECLSLSFDIIAKDLIEAKRLNLIHLVSHHPSDNSTQEERRFYWRTVERMQVRLSGVITLRRSWRSRQRRWRLVNVSLLWTSWTLFFFSKTFGADFLHRLNLFSFSDIQSSQTLSFKASVLSLRRKD